MTNEEVIKKLDSLQLTVKPDQISIDDHKSPEAYVRFIVLQQKVGLLVMNDEDRKKDLQQDMDTICKEFNINPDEIEVVLMDETICNKLEEIMDGNFYKEEALNDPLLAFMIEILPYVGNVPHPKELIELFNKHFSQYIEFNFE